MERVFEIQMGSPVMRIVRGVMRGPRIGRVHSERREVLFCVALDGTISILGGREESTRFVESGYNMFKSGEVQRLDCMVLGVGAEVGQLEMEIESSKRVRVNAINVDNLVRMIERCTFPRVQSAEEPDDSFSGVTL
jgi:hypothetical protein